MKSDDRDRMLERLLDSALAVQHVEPREGLEQRILANLRTQPARRPAWRWMWIPAAVAAAVLLFAGLRLMRSPEPASKPVVTEEKPAPATAPKQSPTPAVATKHRAPVAAVPRAVAVTKSAPALPRQETFPSPVPLTDQEKMLLAFVRRDRAEAVLVAQTQENDRQRIEKYFETGKVPEPQPEPAQPMR